MVPGRRAEARLPDDADDDRSLQRAHRSLYAVGSLLRRNPSGQRIRALLVVLRPGGAGGDKLGSDCRICQMTSPCPIPPTSTAATGMSAPPFMREIPRM